eukprot:jgi/Botrbrau1/20754/Bobra.0539s0001.1
MVPTFRVQTKQRWSLVSGTLQLLPELGVLAQVAIYNYMKLQVIRQKAALSTSKDAEKEGVGNAKAVSAGDASSNGNYSSFRSKEDILEEIKRLQTQMASLESRSTINTVGSKEN